MKRKNNLKLPNGFGSVHFLGENRRCPYGARVTTGKDENGKAIRPYIGYGKTWNEAYQILLKYNNMPYNTDNKNTTLAEVYAILEPKLQDDYLNEKMSKSNYDNMISVYKNHLYVLGNKKIIELKKKEVQDIINNSGLKYTGRNYIKNIFSRLIDYSINELGLNVDTNILNLEVGKKEKSKKHYPFIEKEIEIIKEKANTKLIARFIMIYLYTGMRPSELLSIETNNVFLNEYYMIGGSKTEAGRDRIIPIHSNIKSYIEELYDQDNKYLVINKNTNQQMSYDTYQKKFDEFMKELNMKHTAYDTRHTFATKCAKVGISDMNIKIIMGHSTASDVTNDVYIHRDVEMLRNEIEKINY